MSADNTKNLLGSTSGVVSTATLGNGSPSPSVSGATFFLNFHSRDPPSAMDCHTSRCIPCITQWLSKKLTFFNFSDTNLIAARKDVVRDVYFL